MNEELVMNSEQQLNRVSLNPLHARIQERLPQLEMETLTLLENIENEMRARYAAGIVATEWDYLCEVYMKYIQLIQRLKLVYNELQWFPIYSTGESFMQPYTHMLGQELNNYSDI